MVEKALSGMKTADLSGLPEKEYFVACGRYP